MKNTKQCFACKQSFLKAELVDYASPRAKIMHSYCEKCLKEKQSKDYFSDEICRIFGIKSPGPRIWAERLRLQSTYGYTDSVIIRCLDYIYNVEHAKKLSESLCLVNPSSIERMETYWRCQDRRSNTFVQAVMSSKVQEINVNIEENNRQRILNNWNPDDFLDD